MSQMPEKVWQITYLFPHIFFDPEGEMVEKKFEPAMKRLEEIVQNLEDGQLPLEDSLKVFEEGMRLVKFCSKKLEEAEKKVSLLIKESGGKHSLAPFDPEGEEDDDQ